jgi:hypothetical protein
LPTDKQLEIAQLIQDELNWKSTFKNSQDKLNHLANDAIKEFKAGKTTENNW